MLYPMSKNCITISLLALLFSLPAMATPQHGFSIFDKLKYQENFEHYDYTNPNAPKGGRLVIGALGTFDSLNSFIVKGTPAAGMSLIHARLCDEPHDRAGEAYGYIAERLEYPEDHSWIIFHLRPTATFSDGHPITTDDVIWSFETLKEKGVPMYRTYFKNVSKVEQLSPHRVKFHFNTTNNRELPLVVGQLPIFPKHYYETVNFNETTLKAAPGSGPYIVKTIDPGRSITYERIKDWWGENIACQRGENNFDEIRFDYYMDDNAMLEAFKAGKIDWRQESSIRTWKTGYDFPARQAGLVKLAEIKTELTSPTYGFFFNLRRPIFQNIKVRQALNLVFDFAWANKNLFYDAYKRNLSFFPNSPFAATGVPTATEIALLSPYKDQIPTAILTESFTLPETTDTQEIRRIQQQALALLNEAGWEVTNQILIHKETKTPFTFEIINYNKNFEKVFLSFAQSLKRIGITLKIRTLDLTTYTNRVESLDYDMIFTALPQSTSLGNEQRDYFGSERADAPGTQNFAGIKNPVIDALIENLIASPTYAELGVRSRALDRVLLFNYYIIPAWHSDLVRIAYWDKLSHPTVSPKYHPAHFLNWWFDADKIKALKEKKSTIGNESMITKIKNAITNLFK